MSNAEVLVREARADDAVTIAAIRAAAVPHLVGTADGTRARLQDADTSGAWVATLDGMPAGFVLTRSPHQDAARVTLMVHPEHTRRGVGSALLARGEAQVAADGARKAHSVADGDAGRAFATARGYAVGREHRFASADLAAIPDPPPVPPGIELRPLSDVDPYAIWTLHELVAPDDPSGLSISQPYETWYAEDWAFPDHAADLGLAALDGTTPVAFTHVFADRARGAIWSAMTGVHPAHRGRGLARLVKAHAMRTASAAGITRAFTANDAANAPMLAVNSWLGYRPAAQAWSVQRQFGSDGLRH